MSKAGRKPGLVLEHVIKPDPHLSSCMYCPDFTISCNSTGNPQSARHADHAVLSCANCPDDVRRRIADAHNTKAINTAKELGKLDHLYPDKDQSESTFASTAAASSSASTTTATTTVAHRPKKQKTQASITNHVSASSTSKIGPALLKELNMLLITLIVGCGLSFNVVASVFFVNFIKMLNPAYAKVMPTRTCLPRTWLPNLYLEVKKKVYSFRRNNSAAFPYLTVGLDAVKTQSGDKINVTESCGPFVQFNRCIDPGTNSQNHHYYAEKIVTVINEGAADAGSTPFDVYAAVVMDNTSTNYAAFKLVEQVFPWLICLGCRTHFFDLVCEDVFNIDEFKAILKAVLAATKFIKGHKRVLKLFEQIKGKGPGVVTYPDTRFAYAALTLYRFQVNMNNFFSMINHPDWDEITESIKKTQVDKFEATVLDAQFYAKVRKLHSLASVLSKIIHHSEATYFQASWTLPLYFSLGWFIEDWIKANNSTFSDATAAALKNIYVRRYHGTTGRGAIIGVYHPALVMAMILDPNTQSLCSRRESNPFLLDLDLEGTMRSELSRFYTDDLLAAATLQLKRLLISVAPGANDDWSRARRPYDKAVVEWFTTETSYDANRPSPECMIRVQTEVYDVSNALADWQLTGSSIYPQLGQVAPRYLCMTTQSANVERVCKANKFIHTSARHLLKAETVDMLLFCYVNLHLLEKETSGKLDALAGSVCFDVSDYDDEAGDDAASSSSIDDGTSSTSSIDNDTSSINEDDEDEPGAIVSQDTDDGSITGPPAIDRTAATHTYEIIGFKN